jgi:hypothetical protein
MNPLDKPSTVYFCKDIWSFIIKWIPSSHLARFRILSKTHQKLVTKELHKRCTLLDDLISIVQLMDFARQRCVTEYVSQQSKNSTLPEKNKITCLEKVACRDCWNRCVVEERASDDSDDDIPDSESLDETRAWYPKPTLYHFNQITLQGVDSAEHNLGEATMTFRERALVYLQRPIKFTQPGANIEQDCCAYYTIPAGFHSVYNFAQSRYLSCMRRSKFDNSLEWSTWVIHNDCDPSQQNHHLEYVDEAIHYDNKESVWVFTPGCWYSDKHRK